MANLYEVAPIDDSDRVYYFRSVVVADSEADAMAVAFEDKHRSQSFSGMLKPDQIKAEFIGVAADHMKRGPVVVAI